MKYYYYPGCSLKGSGRGYEESLLAVLARLGVEIEELAGWNCCGATAYMSVDEKKAFALAARNLALAARNNKSDPVTLMAPCNACYLVLSKAQKYIAEYEDIRKVIVAALQERGLEYDRNVHVRHPLDVLMNDVGAEKITAAVKDKLSGMKVACYYGCQVVRPYATFDDQYDPASMDTLLQAAGAQTVDWPMKTRCCGGTLTGTIEEAGQRLSYIILREAKKRGAEVVATACPLCQFNLECYQQRMSAAFDDDVNIPVVYFTQLLGRSMGIDDRTLGLQRGLTTLQPA